MVKDKITVIVVEMCIRDRFCGGLGFGRLFEIYGIMEYCFLGLLLIIDVLLIYKVYKLYAMQPKAIVLLLGLECCSILLWIAFICIDQSLLDWQITSFILQAVNLDGFEEMCIRDSKYPMEMPIRKRIDTAEPYCP